MVALVTGVWIAAAQWTSVDNRLRRIEEDRATLIQHGVEIKNLHERTTRIESRFEAYDRWPGLNAGGTTK